jgi:hypothetical protein
MPSSSCCAAFPFFPQGGLDALDVGLWWPAAVGRNRQLLYALTVVVAEQVQQKVVYAVARGGGEGGKEGEEGEHVNAAVATAEWTVLDTATLSVGFRSFECVGPAA